MDGASCLFGFPWSLLPASLCQAACSSAQLTVKRCAVKLCLYQAASYCVCVCVFLTTCMLIVQCLCSDDAAVMKFV